jgi:hypothetical protein
VRNDEDGTGSLQVVLDDRSLLETAVGSGRARDAAAEGRSKNLKGHPRGWVERREVPQGDLNSMGAA